MRSLAPDQRQADPDSTPILNLRWYLVHLQPHRRKAIALVNTAYLCMFAVCRIYLIYYILEVYGSYTRESAFQTFRKRLLLPCQVGTGLIAITNVTWWVMGVRNLLVRYRGGLDGLARKRS